MNDAILASALPLCSEDESLLADMANWTVPEYSRNQVDKAGFALIAPLLSLDDLVSAYVVINNWRSAHSYPLLNFRMNLKAKLRAVCPDALVAQRIKRLESITVKLGRGTMQLSQMQDIGGCRAVMNSVEQVERLVTSYKRSNFAHRFRGEKDYIISPKDDGY